MGLGCVSLKVLMLGTWSPGGRVLIGGGTLRDRISWDAWETRGTAFRRGVL